MPHTKITVWDLSVIIAVIIGAVIMFLFLIQSDDGNFVEIVSKDGAAKRYPLSKDKTIEIESSGIRLCIEISGGTVCVKDSTCKDQICVHTGKIKKSGQTIICAPAGISITITGGESDADDIAG